MRMCMRMYVHVGEERVFEAAVQRDSSPARAFSLVARRSSLLRLPAAHMGLVGPQGVGGDAAAAGAFVASRIPTGLQDTVQIIE